MEMLEVMEDSAVWALAFKQEPGIRRRGGQPWGQGGSRNVLQRYLTLRHTMAQQRTNTPSGGWCGDERMPCRAIVEWITTQNSWTEPRPSQRLICISVTNPQALKTTGRSLWERLSQWRNLNFFFFSHSGSVWKYVHVCLCTCAKSWMNRNIFKHKVSDVAQLSCSTYLSTYHLSLITASSASWYSL